MEQEKIAALHTKYISSTGSYKKELSSAFIADIFMQSAAMARITDSGFDCVLLGTSGVITAGKSSLTIHVDREPTMHTTYLGTGLEYYPGRAGNEVDVLNDSKADGEILPAGHVILFKGEYASSELALPHRTPAPERSGPRGRIALSIY